LETQQTEALEAIAPRMNVERVPLDSLALDPANVRTHDPRNLEAIKGSLARFGQQKPIVVDSKGVIRAGNGTLEAARVLGWDSILIVRTDLDGLEATAYAIADNRTSDLSEFDDVSLGRLLEELRAEDALAGVGFTSDEIDVLLRAAEPETLEDEGPGERPDNPVSTVGDLWLLGDHRVLCGDSTDPSCMERLLNGDTPRLMVTDPPYGVSYDPSWRNEAGVSSTERTGKVMHDDRVDWSAVWKLFPGDVAYIWHAGKYCGEVAAHLHQAGFDIRAQIIWAKNRFALSRGNYHWQHEPCWYAVRHGRKAHWVGDRKQSTVWDIAASSSEDKTKHGTQKPLECMGRPMRNHDAPVVLDPFLGSGSTLIAAERLGRKSLGLELDPGYMDVVVDRWQRATGKVAKLDSGETFEGVREARGLEGDHVE
jgi:DNA modification methylase